MAGQISCTKVFLVTGLPHDAQIQWVGFVEELEWAEDNVCGGFTEFESVDFSCLYDSCIGSQFSFQNRQTGVALFCDLSDGSTISKDMNRLIAFYKGLTTWARWIDQNIDPGKTKVFFQGVSPTHFQCNRIRQPLAASTYPGGTPPEAEVVYRVLSRIAKPVFLWISLLCPS